MVVTKLDEATPSAPGGQPVAWEANGQGGPSGLQWDVPGADRFQVLWLPVTGKSALVAEGGELSALSLPAEDTQAGAGRYAVVALKDGTVIATSVVGTGDPKAKAKLTQKISEWQKWGELAPHLPDQKTPVGAPKTDEVDEVQRTTQEYKLTRTPEELITFNPNINELYPGAIVRSSDAIRGGLLVDAGIDASDRAPLRVSVDALVGKSAEPIAQPSYSRVLGAIKKMVEGAKAGSRDIVFRKTEAYSDEEVALELGVSAQYGGFSGSLKIDAKRSSKMNTVVVYLRERAFTASCDLGMPDSYIADSFTEEKLNELINYGRMGHLDPPLIVSNVIYGRILMFSFTSTASETEINAALQASYNGFANIDAEMKAKYKEIATEAKIDIIARGGPGKDVQAAIVSGDINKYFEDAPPLEAYTIIGYTLHTLDGYPAKMSETTNYGRISWGAGTQYTVNLEIGTQYVDLWMGDGGAWAEVSAADVVIDGKRTKKVNDSNPAKARRTFDGHGNGQPFLVDLAPDGASQFVELSPHGMNWFTHGETDADGYAYVRAGMVHTKVHYSASRA